MIVGISSFELHLPSSRSLKDKRRIVKSLVDRIHQRFRVSVAETGFHDLHQRAEISLAIVTNSEGEMENLMAEIRSLVDREPEAFLTHWDPQILEGH
jgi:uncharacterized protein YlxP (DUF503 family)